MSKENYVPVRIAPQNRLERVNSPVPSIHGRGLIPGVVRGKGRRFAVVGPVTPKRISKIKNNVLKFRCKPGRKKLNYFAPIQLKKDKLCDLEFPPWNLHTSMLQFEWWLERSDRFEMWSDMDKRNVLNEISAVAAVALRLAKDLNKEMPLWDGTKSQLKGWR